MEGLSTRRFNLLSLPGLLDVVSRLDLIPRLPQIGCRYFGNDHHTGRFGKEGIRLGTEQMGKIDGNALGCKRASEEQPSG
jgi:hypothetical protein